ncbi:bifunctional riboflavin kinase/FAD synthetase [Leucothrix arctica]|uniref:Riboflavin biosynthesis protein n=1 Tax=Leucothrix arctica TaxID=1481894 RepID=A0A317C755_9GAMM|nr:bifunctional riboflavin kinase/FAD synthetase [Leucothrix arctica]PWQ94474.1 bifunctional riboflavin kinase/FAD synthetase [Leucothrix arctica]
MKLIRDIKEIAALKDGCVATIGNFDGLHLGHQHILQQLERQSQQYTLPKVVISFEPLPTEYFSDHQSPRIYPFRDKCRYLEEMGVDYFLCLRFNQALSKMPAEAFVSNILLNAANVRALVVGDDFCFGKDRKGNFELLESMGKLHNMQVSNSLTHADTDGRVSSTRIRKQLMSGDTAAAAELLGRKYCLSGRIRHGAKLGRTIGFPTLNLRIQDNIATVNGVYAVKVKGLSDTPLLGVANLGNRPTVDGIETRLETHLFDFDQSVYGRHIEVELIKFLRPEKKFDSFDMLKEQIAKDATQAKTLLQAYV